MQNKSEDSTRHGFTLVELLVVIGIIAVLISLLLPALARARDQANGIQCQSNMRQVYQLMTLYTGDYKGYVMPATESVPGALYYWWTPALLGNELNHIDTTQDNSENAAIAKILFCPSALHDLDLGGAAAGTNDQGDYTYNGNLGALTIATNGTVTYGVPLWKLNQVPGNVIVLTDLDKAYVQSQGQNLWGASVFGNLTYLVGSHGTWPGSTGQAPSMWTPHAKSTRANMLFMDGHVSSVAPNDLVVSGSGGNISTGTIPWTYTPSASGIQLKGYLTGYWKNGAWSTPWQDGVVGP